MSMFLEELRRRPLKRKFLYIFWCLLHIIFHFLRNCTMTFEIVRKKVTRRVSSLFITCPCPGNRVGSEESRYHVHDHTQIAVEEVEKLAQSAAKLAKLPKHLAFSIIPENNSSWNLSGLDDADGFKADADSTYILGKVVGKSKKSDVNGKSCSRDSQKIHMQTLAKVISWAWATKIPLISLYDYHGEIKDCHHELGYLLQEELVQNYLASKNKNSSNIQSPPTIKFHNVPNINGYSNGMNNIKNSNALHIAVFSHKDGKEAIAEVTKTICQENLRRNSVIAADSSDLLTMEVNESIVDGLLSTVQNLSDLPVGVPPDPEVLVVVGNILSSLEFLPWNIRLTEMYWVPKLPVVESEDFIDVLRKYSRCQQRYGT